MNSERAQFDIHLTVSSPDADARGVNNADARGVNSVVNMSRLNLTEPVNFVFCDVSLLSKTFNQNCLAVVKSLPVYCYRADNIFSDPFGSLS